MPCFHPLKGYRSPELTKSGKLKIVFTPTNAYRDRTVLVPCGQCVGCRLERSRQWAIRCFHEASLYDANSFITLTYDDDHLPSGPSLNKQHLSKFMKDLRDVVSYARYKNPKTGRWKKTLVRAIRFYGCGEYGEKYRRPHYHVCIFNWEPPDKSLWKTRDGVRLYQSDLVDQIWGQGYTLTGDVTFQSAAYVARYIMKKVTGASATSHYENVDPDTGEIFQLEPEFTNMSRAGGIGRQWFEKWRNDVVDHDHVVINGKAVKPPKYYDRLWQAEVGEELFQKNVTRKRKQASLKHAANNTPERLKVREKVQMARLERLPRNLEEH